MSEGNQNTPVDPESQKLLDELAKQDKTSEKKKAAPKKKAASKTNKAPASSKAGPGTVLVAEKSEPAPVTKTDDNTVTNIGKNPRRIGGTTVGVGESYTLTEQDLNDESLLLKIDHAIEQGILRHGAD